MMGDENLPLMEAARYLGVSRVKLSQLARDGVVLYTTSALDKRVKLFKRQDLDVLKRAPRARRGGARPAVPHNGGEGKWPNWKTMVMEYDWTSCKNCRLELLGPHAGSQALRQNHRLDCDPAGQGFTITCPRCCHQGHYFADEFSSMEDQLPRVLRERLLNRAYCFEHWAQIKEKYPGKWVAVSGETVIAAGSCEELLAGINAEGWPTDTVYVDEVRLLAPASCREPPGA